MAKTITINVSEEVAEEFKRFAGLKYGKKKGYLGKAFADAMKNFMAQRSGDADRHALQLLKKGMNLGGIKVKERAKWHER